MPKKCSGELQEYLLEGPYFEVRTVYERGALWDTNTQVMTEQEQIPQTWSVLGS